MKGTLILKFPSLSRWFGIMLCVMVLGCTEDPTSVGLNFLRPGDIPKIKIDTLYPVSHSTEFTPVNTAGSDRLLLGKYSAYDALIALSFSNGQSVNLDTVFMTSSIIELRAVYHFGDSLAPIAFSTFRAIANSDSATYDSLTLLAQNYYSATPYSVIAPTILADTSVIDCPIDTGDVHNWFTSAGSPTNYGVIMKASNLSTIKGFASFYHQNADYWPKLIVNYLNKDGIPGTFTFNTGKARFVANIPKSSLVIDQQLLYVQSGVAYRGVLNFGLDPLPKAAAILKVNLELTLDPTASVQNSYTADSLYSHYVNADGTLSTGLIESVTNSYSNPTRKIYQFAIRDFVRAWANTGIARSLQFGGARETSSLDLYAIYGSLSSADKRPRLIITSSYTLQ